MLYAGALPIFWTITFIDPPCSASMCNDMNGEVSISLNFVVSLVNLYVKYTYVNVAQALKMLKLMLSFQT